MGKNKENETSNIPKVNVGKEINDTLETYLKEVTKNITESEHVKQHVRLYSLLIKILKIEDYNTFSKQWNIVTSFFMKHPELELQCHKYDYVDFLGNNNKDKTFITLVSLLTTLSDRNTRDKELYDINKAISYMTGINDVGIRNLVSYYR